jgi:hypothetical protein
MVEKIILKAISPIFALHYTLSFSLVLPPQNLESLNRNILGTLQKTGPDEVDFI